MARQYYGGSATTAQALGTNLHTVLTGAGWSLEHADSTAIGTGSATAPAWDGTVTAAGDSYGSAIYSMPTPSQAEQDAGIVTQWVVRLEFVAAGTNADGVTPRITTGRSVTDGVLQDAGTVIGLESISGADGVATAPFHLMADAHGVAVVVEGSYGYAYTIERSRSTGGQLNDDITVAGVADGYVNPIGWSARYGAAITRAADFGEYAAAPWVGFGEFNSSSLSKSSSLAANGNQAGLPVGPFMNSGGIAGVLRNFLIMPEEDTPAGGTQNVRVGEQVWAYKALSASAAEFCPALGTFLVAGTQQVS